MANKILGYIMLVIGIIIIIFSVWQSYNIFFGKASAPFIFITPASSQSQQNTTLQSSQGLLGLLGAQTISQEQIEQAIGNQIGQIIPVNDITKILNLISWSVFAGILIIAGGTISSIGVKLLNGDRNKQ